MRERTRMDRNLIERLPNLKLIASTGLRNAAIDLEAAAEHGIKVVITRYESTPTIEFTWAMILGLAQNLHRKCIPASWWMANQCWPRFTRKKAWAFGDR